MINTRKIGIIGAGHVGSHCAFSMILQGICDDITFVDVNEEKAVAQALDCMDTLAFLPHKAIVKSGTIKDLADKDIIIICVGTIDNISKDRLFELDHSLKIIKSFVPEIIKTGFNGHFIVITNPVDIITYYVQQLSGLPYNQVIGTGTGLDSARLRRILSVETGIDARSIQAYMLGEHGDSQVAAFSSAFINGKSLFDLIAEKPEKFFNIDFEAIEKKTAETGWDILCGKNSTEFGIACVCSEIVRAIFHDEKKIIPCSAFLQGEYDTSNIYAGVPAVIGKDGIEYIIELPLNESEKKKLSNTFDIIKHHIERGKRAIED
ncbi:L-lactate dehydrogenase [Fusobacterium sp.]|uniref:L-lactate dehydrogenase n=1 Tax=Fusobacterium sp. TaxID=68766 RepID=UPI0028FE17E6|nr:L-lactate dehydrogenase [Fusobacterium sp.]MDU1911816.1 L-lactate dehydrogenase [Fusobacterium sp.]